MLIHIPPIMAEQLNARRHESQCPVDVIDLLQDSLQRLAYQCAKRIVAIVSYTPDNYSRVGCFVSKEKFSFEDYSLCHMLTSEALKIVNEVLECSADFVAEAILREKNRV